MSGIALPTGSFTAAKDIFEVDTMSVETADVRQSLILETFPPVDEINK